MAKRWLELDDEALLPVHRACSTGLHRRPYHRLRGVRRDLRAKAGTLLLEESGVPRAQIEQLADIYIKGSASSPWGMGLTQHKHSVPPSRCCPT
jgi:anaerobic selenocysteine-containing dehydrogenase